MTRRGAGNTTQITGQPSAEGLECKTLFPPLQAVPRLVVNTLRDLHYDSASELTLANLRSPMREAHDYLFGKPISYGIMLTFPMGANLHLRNADLHSILRSIRENKNKLSESIDRYQGLSGITPSKPGFRVFAVLLRSNSEAAPDEMTKFRAFCAEALALDLKSPKDPNWQKQLVLPFNGIPTRVTLSLTPISSVTRALLTILQTDLPETERSNRYSYRIKLEPETFSESFSLRLIKQVVRQAVACGAFFAPIAAAQYAMSSSAFRTIISHISSDTSMHKIIFNVAQLSIFAAVGTATYLALRAYETHRTFSKHVPKD